MNGVSIGAPWGRHRAAIGAPGGIMDSMVIPLLSHGSVSRSPWGREGCHRGVG